MTASYRLEKEAEQLRMELETFCQGPAYTAPARAVAHYRAPEHHAGMPLGLIRPS